MLRPIMTDHKLLPLQTLRPGFRKQPKIDTLPQHDRMWNCLLVTQGELLGCYTYVCVHECLWIDTLEVFTPVNALPKQETLAVNFVECLTSASKWWYQQISAEDLPLSIYYHMYLNTPILMLLLQLINYTSFSQPPCSRETSVMLCPQQLK